MVTGPLRVPRADPSPARLGALWFLVGFDPRQVLGKGERGTHGPRFPSCCRSARVPAMVGSLYNNLSCWVTALQVPPFSCFLRPGRGGGFTCSLVLRFLNTSVHGAIQISVWSLDLLREWPPPQVFLLGPWLKRYFPGALCLVFLFPEHISATGKQ